MRLLYKAPLTALLALASFLLVALLWKSVPLLTFLLATIGGLMIVIGDNFLGDLLLFISCGAMGTLAELLSIHYGAWAYALPSFAGIPLWLPFLWGTAAVFMKRTSAAISYARAKK